MSAGTGFVAEPARQVPVVGEYDATRIATTISTMTASHDTRRAEPSPRNTPSISSAIALHAMKISGSAG